MSLDRCRLKSGQCATVCARGESKRVTDEEEEEEEEEEEGDDDDDDDDDDEEEEEEGEKERALLGTPFQKRGVSPAHGL